MFPLQYNINFFCAKILPKIPFLIAITNRIEVDCLGSVYFIVTAKNVNFRINIMA